MFHGLVKSKPDLFTVLTPPAFALTVLTVVPRRVSGKPSDTSHTKPKIHEGVVSDDVLPHNGSQAGDRANELTKKVYETINAAGEIFLTSSVVKGVYTIRVVSANPKADGKHLRRAFEILVETTEDILNKKNTQNPLE